MFEDINNQNQTASGILTNIIIPSTTASTANLVDADDDAGYCETCIQLVKLFNYVFVTSLFNYYFEFKVI